MAQGKKWIPTAADRKEIQRLAAYLTHEQIAVVYDINSDTLKKHCVEELAKGKANKTLEVAELLIKLGKKGNVAALIFYLKTQAGWREKQEDQGDRTERIQIELVSEGKPLRVVESERKRGNGNS